MADKQKTTFEQFDEYRKAMRLREQSTPTPYIFENPFTGERKEVYADTPFFRERAAARAVGREIKSSLVHYSDRQAPTVYKPNFNRSRNASSYKNELDSMTNAAGTGPISGQLKADLPDASPSLDSTEQQPNLRVGNLSGSTSSSQGGGGFMPSAVDAYKRAQDFFTKNPMQSQATAAQNQTLESVRKQYPNVELTAEGSVYVPTKTIEDKARTDEGVRGWEQYANNLRALYRSTGMPDDQIAEKLKGDEKDYFERRDKISALGGNVRLMPKAGGGVDVKAFGATTGQQPESGRIIKTVPEGTIKVNAFTPPKRVTDPLAELGLVGRRPDVENYGARYNAELASMRKATDALSKPTRASTTVDELAQKYPRRRGESPAQYNARLSDLEKVEAQTRPTVETADKDREQRAKEHEDNLKNNSDNSAKQFALSVARLGIDDRQQKANSEAVAAQTYGMFQRLRLDKLSREDSLRLQKQVAEHNASMQKMKVLLDDEFLREKLTIDEAKAAAAHYRALQSSFVNNRTAIQKSYMDFFSSSNGRPPTYQEVASYMKGFDDEWAAINKEDMAISDRLVEVLNNKREAKK